MALYLIDGKENNKTSLKTLKNQSIQLIDSNLT